MRNWLRDIAVYNYAPDKIINKDLSAQIQTAADKTPIDALILKIKAIDKAERDIKANSNIRLTMDSLMITLSKG